MPSSPSSGALLSLLRSILLCGSWGRDLLEDGMYVCMYILLYASFGRVVCMFRLNASWGRDLEELVSNRHLFEHVFTRDLWLDARTFPKLDGLAKP